MKSILIALIVISISMNALSTELTFKSVANGNICSSTPWDAHWNQPIELNNQQNLDVPKNGFKTPAELHAWSSRQWGGGWADSIQLDNKKLFYSHRSFTSGVATTEIIFFSKQGDRIIPFLEIPTQRRELLVKLHQNKESEAVILIEAWDDEAKSFQHALTLTKSMIP